MIDKTAPAVSLRFPADDNEAFTVLLNTMYSYSSLHNIYLHKTAEKHEIYHGESLVGAVYLVLDGPSYRIRRLREVSTLLMTVSPATT